jgi:catechol 2,3-dioxygenase-like lactoylglutathione lyase family enzyme
MNDPSNLDKMHLRVDRPTDNLVAVIKFYRDGLGFEVLYEFKDHDGFDGVMLGGKGAAYYLEFISRAGHEASRAPTEDNLLVFYTPDGVDGRRWWPGWRTLGINR